MPPSKSLPSILTALLAFDKAIHNQHLKKSPERILIGVDEVGRGSLIGPVIAAAVALPPQLTPVQKKQLRYLNDSKRLPRTIRAELSEAIRFHFPSGIGEATKAEVDSLNVHYASLLAGQRAYMALLSGLTEHLLSPVLPYILVDGRTCLTGIPVDIQKPVIKGDGKSACIAAASVLAKETRDRMICTLAADFPGYGWETNMGYPTPTHQQALQQYGPTEHHRIHYKTVQACQLHLPLPAFSE